MSNNNYANGTLPIVIQMGICRFVGCHHKGQLGLLGTRCPGNHRFPLRSGYHMFDRLRSSQDFELCNNTDISSIVGVCMTTYCYSIGNLNSVCRRCMKNERFNIFTNVRHQNVVNPLVPFFVTGTRIRMMIPVREINGALPRLTPPPGHTDEDSILSNLSFYTPEYSDDEVEEELWLNPVPVDLTTDEILQQSFDLTLERDLDETNNPY